MHRPHHACCLIVLAAAASPATAQRLALPSPAEVRDSTAVRLLGVDALHTAGLQGLGVTVAVVDTGLDTSHPEFAGRLRPAINAAQGGSDVTDAMGHGTHVAGIIAAAVDGRGTVGIAPRATLLPIKVFSSNVSSSTDINRGLSAALSQGARVVNMSLGATSPTGTAVLSQAARSNQALIVVAAGNDGQANPRWPARYARESWANGTIIAVGAVNADGSMAAYSNRAGDAAAQFLVAPGTNINSTLPGGGYGSMSGTSMAAPAVSGAAALVFSHWPYLKANEVGALLLQTADDLGAKGTDRVYGRGRLNVQRAMAPQGSLNYVSVNGRRISMPLNAWSPASRQPSVSSPRAFEGLRSQVFDRYGRNFMSAEGAALAVRTQLTADNVLGRTDRMLDAADRTLPGGTRVTRWQATAPVPTAHGEDGLPRALSGTGRTSQGVFQPWRWERAQAPAGGSAMLVSVPGIAKVSLGDGGLSDIALGLAASDMAPALAGLERVIAQPLAALSPAHRFAAASTSLGAGWWATAGFARGQAAPGERTADLNVLEVTYQGGGQALNISVGSMAEQGLLGGYSNAALGLAQATRTTGVTVSGAWRLAPGWSFAAAYSVAETGAPQAAGLLLYGTRVTAQGHAAGLVKFDTWRRGDRLSATVTAPLRATGGSLTYSVVDGVNPDDGTPSFSTHTVDLKPAKREWQAEARYVTPLAPGRSLTLVAALRRHPDHDAAAPSQKVVGVRYALAF